MPIFNLSCVEALCTMPFDAAQVDRAKTSLNIAFCISNYPLRETYVNSTSTIARSG